MELDKLGRICEEGVDLRRSAFTHNRNHIIQAAELIDRALSLGNKVMFCGNGGSAADSMHLAAEFVGRLRSYVNREALPAISLTLDPVSMSAIANDYGFEEVYARAVEALGHPRDVLVAISTSGTSRNVISALRVAQSKGITTIGLLGSMGGEAMPLCTLPIVVNSYETARVQEVHISIGHAIAELVEDKLVAKTLRKQGIGQ